MIGLFSLTNPSLLWGLTALLLPVAIHLLLRPRPRRVWFPALRLMRGTLTSSQRASRLRNVVLMLVRAGVLGVTVLFLAGPTCSSAQPDFTTGDPIACVLVLDDSLSLHARVRFADPSTLLDVARERAVSFLEQAGGWPAESRLAVLRAGAPQAEAALTANQTSLLAVLRDRSRDTLHAQPLGQAFERAATLLRPCQQQQRRIVIVTDLAASAWRDVRPAALAGVADVLVQVLSIAPESRTDFGVVAVRPPAHVWPESISVPVRVTVRATDVGADCWLVAEAQQKVLTRVGPLSVPAGGTRDVIVDLPPMPPGPHGATLRLEPEDLLAADQQQFVVWQTDRKPQVWVLVGDGGEQQEDLTALIVRNLLAPEALGPHAQRVTVETLTAAEVAARLPATAVLSEGAADARPPALVLVLPGVELEGAAREGLLRSLEAGTTVLLLPAGADRFLDWPVLRALLSESLPTDEVLATPAAIRWEGDTSGIATADELVELSRCNVRRRVRLEGLHSEVQRLAAYSDGVPAVIARTVGRGRLVVLTTSPDPEWSDLGVRAAGLMTWLHALVGAGLGRPTAAEQFTAGQTSHAVFAELPAAGLVTIAAAPPAEVPDQWVRLKAGEPQQPWPTSRAGLYTVRGPSGTGRVARYAVNWPAEEFDLTPISHAELVRTLGTERVTLEQLDGAEGALGESWLGRLLRFAVPAWVLALVLLLAFVFEMVFAASRDVPRAAPQAPPGSSPQV